MSSTPAPGSPLPRRTVLTGVAGAAALAAFLPEAHARAAAEDYPLQAFQGLAAYVVPGDDPYSVRQGVTAPRPGGVAAGAGPMLLETYDAALGLFTAPELSLNLPGAAGIALIMDLWTQKRFLTVGGPFEHPFANLTFDRKARVLADLDQDGLLAQLPIGYAFGTPITLAAFGAYGEREVFDRATGTLYGRPVGWDLADYDGVSDGWPEFQGYWRGRTAAEDVA